MNTEVSSFNGNGNGANNPQIQEESTAKFSIVDIVENIYFFRWAFLLIFVSILLVSILYALLASPIYISDALVQVEDKKSGNLTGLQVGQLPSTASSLIGEMEIISSRTVISEAVEALNANVTFQVQNRLPIVGNFLARTLTKGPDGLVQPLWEGSKWAWGGENLKIGQINIPSQFYGYNYYLKIGQNQAWEMLDSNQEVCLKGKGVGVISENPTQNYALSLDALKAKPGTTFLIRVFSPVTRVGQINSGLTLAESKRGSTIIKLTYADTNPYRAAEILNAIVNSYVGRNISRRSEEAEKSLIFLEKELPRLRMELDNKLKDLNDYRRVNKSLDISSDIKEVLDKASLTETKLLELDLKRKEYLTRYQPEHPIIKAIDIQMSQLSGFKKQINQKIDGLPQLQQEFITKERNLQVQNQLYLSLLNNAQQLRVTKAGTVGNVYIVDAPVVPQYPSKPKKPYIVAGGALLGFLLGVAVTQILALLTQIIHDPKKLEQTLGINILAILPLAVDQIDQIEKNADKAFMIAHDKPTSTSVEAIRSLRTTTLFALSEKPRSKVILITSAVPSQGKSFISSNLAYLFASTNKRVLLIEADVRKPTIKRYVNFQKGTPGLTNYLLNGGDIKPLIMKEAYPNLDFLPAGQTIKNPGDILSSDAMINLVNQLAEEYDYVVIDSPPLLPVNDARSLALCSDVTLFIVRQEMSSISEVREAIDILEKGGSKIDGIVFNGFVPSQIRYSYSYGYGYSGYSRYGKYAKYGNKYGRTYGSYGRYRYKDYSDNEDSTKS
ncbi:polysaccharide biosynthesis tyrosine autokinase [Polynucleobacter rarus]|uniref:polysaccharide biosynthesis tyrosine autokinase n=1 Tax=Polynucleobacter rarus TaxID=556055 RepID=UPI000D3ED1EC|nr:polysaccharide biosynthesis tyrosine autokinase [Polynucleobacter rarus]